MALSVETRAKLDAALVAVDEFYARRLEEIDRDVRNIREYGAPITDLGDQTTAAATSEALAIIQDMLA